MESPPKQGPPRPAKRLTLNEVIAETTSEFERRNDTRFEWDDGDVDTTPPSDDVAGDEE